MRIKFLNLCIWLLMTSGSFLTVFGALQYWESRSAQNQIAEEWQEQSSADVSSAALDNTDNLQNRPKSTLPSHRTNLPPRTGVAVAKLLIPRLDTVLYVVEGTRDQDLKRGPGHLAGTVLPGEHGNCVIAGHRDTHFRVLREIRNGDEVILERGGHEFRYRVDGTTIVKPTNTSSLLPADQPVLNLVTCYPFQYVGAAPKRFIVHAELEGPALQALR